MGTAPTWEQHPAISEASSHLLRNLPEDASGWKSPPTCTRTYWQDETIAQSASGSPLPSWRVRSTVPPVLPVETSAFHPSPEHPGAVTTFASRQRQVGSYFFRIYGRKMSMNVIFVTAIPRVNVSSPSSSRASLRPRARVEVEHLACKSVRQFHGSCRTVRSQSVVQLFLTL